MPAGHVWVGAASGDEISHLSRFGVDPAARSFGAHRFPAEFPPGTPLVAQHTRYLDAHTPSLRSVARIVVGLGGQVPHSTRPGRLGRCSASSNASPPAEAQAPSSRRCSAPSPATRRSRTPRDD